MTAFGPGDRVRITDTAPDGFPIVRYGFVRGCPEDDGPVVVMFDDDLNGEAVVDRAQLACVTITSVELRLDGADLLHNPSLRQGLVNLWSAEAEQAGLEVSALHHVGTGLRDSSEGYMLAELTAGGQQYVLRAVCEPNDSDIVRVSAERPNRWDA
jgi:hypothetical protein